MRRADRLFDIIQALRGQPRPVTAAVLAAELEVNVRTVYRDIATLQARRVPIEGAPGLGYVLRRGFDLPPIMFTAEEIDAIAVGARLTRRIRDPRLHAAAASVLAKLATVLPAALKDQLAAPPLYVSEGSAAVPEGVDPAALRTAIRERRKLRIAYADAAGVHTRRTVWPIAMAYYTDVAILGAWCELRGDYRHFRVERIAMAEMLEARYPADPRLLAGWFALGKDRPEQASPSP
jgi:predicted DNA-binding transcriptional regulator YafY